MPISRSCAPNGKGARRHERPDRLLNGIGAAKKELLRDEYRAISVITWTEVLVGTSGEEEAAIRKTRKIRLPDAIAWATAQEHSLLLVSRNTKDFPADEPGIRVPYKV